MDHARVAKEGPVCLVASTLPRAGSTPASEVSWLFLQTLQLTPGDILRNALAKSTDAELDSLS